MYYLVWYLIAHKALPAIGVNEPSDKQTWPEWFACDETERKKNE
jgi:hypothetical protein